MVDASGNGGVPADESGQKSSDIPVVSPEGSQQVIDEIKAVDAKDSPAEKAMGWGKIATGVLTAIAGIAGSAYGPYVALATVILGIIGFFVLKSAMKTWNYDSNRKKAGDKVGGDVSDGQQKVDDNRDAVDDFLGRDKRSGG